MSPQIKRVSLCALAVAILTAAGAATASKPLAPTDGKAIGPGVGGQVHAFAFDPSDTNIAYAGGDVCGVYKFDKRTGEWKPWSDGLGYGDLNMSYYVDDLLVVRELPGQHAIPDYAEGVYAATWGGVYFRHDDSGPWVCKTSNLSYTGGYANRSFNDGGSHGACIRIPFSSLVLDRAHGKIFAGAGHARFADRANQADTYADMYPCVPASDPRCPAHQWSLWELTLGALSFQMVADSDHGNVRQVAVAQSSAGITSIVYACDEGVFQYEPGGPGPRNIWPSLGKAAFSELDQSDDPWGVAGGSDGMVFVLMSREDPNHRAGLWSLDLDIVGSEWDEPGDPDVDLIWPENVTVTDYLSVVNNDWTELSVASCKWCILSASGDTGRAAREEGVVG